jgi:hypothetical protein
VIEADIKTAPPGVRVVPTSSGYEWSDLLAYDQRMRRFARPLWVMSWIAAAGFVLLLAAITVGVPRLVYVGLGLGGGLPALIMSSMLLIQLSRNPSSPIGGPTPSPVTPNDAGLPAWSPTADADILNRLEATVEEDRSAMEFHAVVDGSIWSELERIPILPDLLEEEPLVHGAWRSWRPESMMLVIFVASTLVACANMSWLFGTTVSPPSMILFYPIMIMGPLFRTPIASGISRAWSHVMPRFTMGTGFLRTRRTGEVIRTDQTILYARRMLGPTGIDDRIMVDLVGVPTSRLFYDGPEDPAFVDLWRRWVHPNPRPELAETGSAD